MRSAIKLNAWSRSHGCQGPLTGRVGKVGVSLKQVTLHFRLCRLSKLLCISHGQVPLQLLPIDFKLLLCASWIHVGIGGAIYLATPNMQASKSRTMVG